MSDSDQFERQDDRSLYRRFEDAHVHAMMRFTDSIYYKIWFWGSVLVLSIAQLYAFAIGEPTLLVDAYLETLQETASKTFGDG